MSMPKLIYSRRLLWILLAVIGLSLVTLTVSLLAQPVAAATAPSAAAADETEMRDRSPFLHIAAATMAA